jgi:hypothetical protein
MLKFS